MRIRRGLEREDWSYVRELCARTGRSGDPIERTRWAFFGEQWVGPYEKLRPEWSYVAESDGGRWGYLTGCPDTPSFRCERAWLFDLPLFLRIHLGSFVRNSDTELFAKRFLRWDLGPEERFDPKATEEVFREYPAHLHVNLEADARGRGVGRALIDRYREDLARIGIHGIHLYCGDKPRGFYRKTGFVEIDRIEFRPGVPVYRLGSRF